MYPGCLANSIKLSDKWLTEHVFVFVYRVEIVFSKDYLHQKKQGKVVKMSNVSSTACSRYHVTEEI